VQTLSTAIPCHYHYLDTQTKFKLARHLKALRQALPPLQTYYKDLLATGTSSARLPLHNPMVPYPCSFSSSNFIRKFTYDTRGVGNNLVFFGQFQDADRQAICIKFTRQYCQQAHEHCASKGNAPRLHAVEEYPGGWHMIVMDDIREDYVSLYDLTNGEEMLYEAYPGDRKLLSEDIAVFLLDLHQEGWVHGDIRNSNIMVKKSSPCETFQLVDFDWSGRIGEARYPLDVNTTTVKRPDAVAGGELIKAEHDIEMLEYIWND
jgi:serine/threonine protein kinase